MKGLRETDRHVMGGLTFWWEASSAHLNSDFTSAGRRQVQPLPVQGPEPWLPSCWLFPGSRSRAATQQEGLFPSAASYCYTSVPFFPCFGRPCKNQAPPTPLFQLTVWGHIFHRAQPLVGMSLQRRQLGIVCS